MLLFFSDKWLCIVMLSWVEFLSCSPLICAYSANKRKKSEDEVDVVVADEDARNAGLDKNLASVARRVKVMPTLG